MRKISRNGLLLMLAMILTGNIKSHAQVAELGNMMAAGTADAKILLQPYITPAVNAFGAAMAGGWYNTAKPHKLGGFDLTFTANVAIIPKKYETFLIDNDDLTFLKLADANDNLAQTVAGENISGPHLVYNVMDENDNVIFTQPAFTMPEGLNSNYIPAPMIQAGIGLVKGTEVMIRYFPNVKISDNEIGLWGLGGKHDIKQWIPGLKQLPVFQMSVMYGYTKLHTFVAMDVNKQSIGAGSLGGEETNSWDDQYLKLIVKSQTANLLVGADLKVVCFYGGVGFVTTKTSLKLEGDFPIVQVPDGEVIPVVVAVSNPIDMEIKNQDGGVTKPRFNAGVRFKLAVVTLHFDYSWANYNVLTAGLGFSFR